MFEFTLETKNGSTNVKYCQKCFTPLHKLDSKENYSYSIGEYVICVEAYVDKGTCPRCGLRWECENARLIRNQAFNNAIDNFWKSKILRIGLKEEELKTAEHVVTTLVNAVGGDKINQVASELGKWLGGVSF